MGKFRSKLKGQTKGKRWPKGQSSNSNPETQKYRNQAKSRFYQENLGNSNLTVNAVRHHDARFSCYGKSEVSTLSESLRDVDIADDVTHKVADDISEGGSQSYGGSSRGSFKTFQTFASDWSECSNVSFNRLLHGFKSNSAFHKEMLAILAAITEVINEKGGTQSSTEYFAALMETLSASEDENGIHATLSLLSMGLKTVPKPVLNAKFSDAGKLFMDLLERFKDTGNQNLMRCLLGCMSVLLRSQAKSVWSISGTAMTMLNYILAFTTHTRPKIRKGAQHAIAAILRGSCFMLEDNPPKVHPAAGRVAEFCLQQFQTTSFNTAQTVILHTLTMLKDILHGFSKEDIKKVCESVLSIMTVSNILLQKCCLQTIHALFQVSTNKKVNKDITDDIDENELSQYKFNTNLTSQLTVKLLQALYDYKPAKTDVPQMQAWVVVMQQGHICLASLDFKDSLIMLPQFVETCACDLWLSDHVEIANSATNALKDILYECVKPACETNITVEQNEVILGKVFASISKALSTPFGHAATHVVHVLAVCFEIGGENCKKFLREPLCILGTRRDPSGTPVLPSTIAQLEYTIGIAIKVCGPEFVLEVIPLVGEDGNINIDRTWLLPLLKDKVHGATIEFFARYILMLASKCKEQSEFLNTNEERNKAHTYDLLCSQLWGLLPAFCNGPTDIAQNFKKIARTLGTILETSATLKETVMSGLRKLIAGARGNDIAALGGYAKNFVPLLFNIVATQDIKSDAALETIQVFLTITPQDKREEFFQKSLIQFEEKVLTLEALLDIIKPLVAYQSKESLLNLFDKVIQPTCELPQIDLHKKKSQQSTSEQPQIDDPHKKKTQQKKGFRLIEQILRSEDENCVAFVKDNKKRIKKLLLQTPFHSQDSSKAIKLRSLELLITAEKQHDPESKLIQEAIIAAVNSVKDINQKCRECAYKLIITIGEVLANMPNGLDGFFTKLIAGFAGEPHLVSSTLLALSSVTYRFSGGLGMENLNFMLQQCCTLLESPKREITSSAISYLHVYSKSLPSPVVANSLEPIMKALSKMSHDCRKNSRLEIGKMLDRLSRKFGADTLIKYTPHQDDVTHKRLRNIGKLQARKKRLRDQKDKDKGGDSSEQNVKQAAQSIEDILADTDSELEDNEPEERKPRKSKKNTAAFRIEEDPDDIVDFTDPSAVSKITSFKPTSRTETATTTNKDPNRGFKKHDDGRLIIDNDSSDSENEGKRASKSKSPRFGSTSDSDEDDMDIDPMPKLGKRKRSDAMSTKSGQSEPATKYRAGGHGIHRPVAASVRSGHTAKSSTKSGFGSEYRSAKASGDVKKSGRVDPYAYVPLSRSSLNKRKRAKNAGQFKGIVKAARKGAAAGSKSKLVKKNV